MIKKKTYCARQLDSSDDKKKGLERTVSDLSTAIEVATESIATFKEEIAALTSGIAELDKSVAEATANRRSEHEEYSELMASDSAAKEILAMAKNRLNQFYNPKLAKGSLMQAATAPPPPPETFGAYTIKSEENGGVVHMINMLIADLDKDMTTAETEEKNAQESYETLMSDSAEKRKADSKSLAEREGAKADTEAALEQHETDKVSATKDLGATMQYIHSLHTECDWLVKYFDVRKQARADEVDSITSAKAVLNGADFSL